MVGDSGKSLFLLDKDLGRAWQANHPQADHFNSIIIYNIATIIIIIY